MGIIYAAAMFVLFYFLLAVATFLYIYYGDLGKFQKTYEDYGRELNVAWGDFVHELAKPLLPAIRFINNILNKKKPKSGR